MQAQGSLAGTRVDKWLWAVRVYKTRTDATEACRAGHVKVNRSNAKAASLVRPGDLVEARSPAGDRVLEVTVLLEKRAGAAVAAAAYVDKAPPAAVEPGPPVFSRDKGAGRPTKRDRRQLQRARQH